MRTDKQNEASRQNGENSRGPSTEAGKRVSSRNSFKTGLYAQSLIIQGEKREDFETLQHEYYTHYQPQTPAERDLLDTMVRLVWQLRRYAHVEAELWDWEVYDQTSRGSISRHYPLGDMFSHCGDKFSRLQRMQNAAQNKFKDALHELERLQAARPAQTIEEETTSADSGFVSSTDEQASEARTEPPSQSPVSSPQPLAAEAAAPWFDPSTIWVHPPYESQPTLPEESELFTS
jgi:hypothetical protein